MGNGTSSKSEEEEDNTTPQTIQPQDPKPISAETHSPIDLEATPGPQDKPAEQVAINDQQTPQKKIVNRQSSTLTDVSDENELDFDTPAEIYARILRKGPPRQGPFPEFRYKCGLLVNYPPIAHIITGIIIFNSLLMVIRTFDFVLDNKSVKDTFDILDTAFLVIFSLESALQLTFHLKGLFRKAWLTFDLILVISSWALPEMTVFRALRILRIAARMKAVKSIMTALITTIPNVGAIFALLMLIFYIFAVMFTTIFKGYPECCSEDVDIDDRMDCPDLDTCVETGYFTRLDMSFFSLFQFLTMDFQGAARMYQKHLSWAPTIFVLFVVVTGYIVFNLIVAVLCDALSVMSDEEDQEEEAQKFKKLTELSEQVRQLQENQDLIQTSICSILTKIEDNMDTSSTGLSLNTPSTMRGISFLTHTSDSNGKLSIRGQIE